MVDAQSLRGIRVIDLTRSIAGPWATRMLADAGAEVIKIEPPTGDFIRQLPARMGEFSSGYFLQANAGKKSLCLDLQSDRGFAVLMSLVPHCDVVVHNMRPNAARRLGLTAERVHASNPDAVFCHINGYGADSPYVGKPGQDLAVQCMTGIAELTGVRSGPPAIAIWSLVDTLTSAYAFLAICAALHARSERGLKNIDVEVMMSQCCALLHDLGPHIMSSFPGVRIERAGQFHPFLVVRGVVQLRDGVIAVSAFRNRHWTKLAPLLGLDARESMAFETRLSLKDEIESRLIARLEGLTVEGALSLLRAAEVPATQAPESLEEVSQLGGFQQRGMLVEAFGGALLAGSMLHKENCAKSLQGGAPKLGSAAFDVLHGMLEMSGPEILELLAQGIINGEPDAVEELVVNASHIGMRAEGVA